MGMSISSKLMVGNTYDELSGHIVEWAEEEYGFDWESNYDIVEVMEQMDLDWASPYFDSDPSEWFIGIAIGPLHLTKFNARGQWNNQVYLAKVKMVELFGDNIELILASSPHVT